MDEETQQIQERYGRAVLCIGVTIQLYSYVLPADLPVSNERLWGVILWFDVLPNFLDRGWTLDAGLTFITYHLPVLALLGLGFIWAWKQVQFKVPAVGILVTVFLLPTGILPLVYLYKHFYQERFAISDQAGILVWNASFWLFFLGFYLLKKSEGPPSNELSDHLID